MFVMRCVLWTWREVDETRGGGKVRCGPQSYLRHGFLTSTSHLDLLSPSLSSFISSIAVGLIWIAS